MAGHWKDSQALQGGDCFSPQQSCSGDEAISWGLSTSIGMLELPTEIWRQSRHVRSRVKEKGNGEQEKIEGKTAASSDGGRREWRLSAGQTTGKAAKPSEV